MKRLAAIFGMIVVSLAFTGCDEDVLDDSRWSMIEDGVESIRYLEFNRGTVRQYSHDLDEDCFNAEEVVAYTVSDYDEESGEGILNIVDGGILVNGESLSEMRFRVDEDELLLIAVNSEVDLGDFDREAEDSEVEIWMAEDFDPVKFRPRCDGFVTPTPSPTPTPVAFPTPTPGPTVFPPPSPTPDDGSIELTPI